MHSPRLRAVLAAIHWGRCTRLALPHASSITRESPGVVARILPMFESKVLRRLAANYAPMLRSCNGSRQHFLNCCVHATSTEAQKRGNSVLTLRFLRARRVSKKECRWTTGFSGIPDHPPQCASAHKAGDDDLGRIVAASRPETDDVPPGCPSRPGSPSTPQNSV
jgi:hypothetical protein